MRGSIEPLDKRPLDFYASREREVQDKGFSLDDIVDAEIHGDKIYFLTANGKVFETTLTPVTRDLYWEVKLRNRRRAFGL